MARAASPTRGRAISSCAPRRSSRCRRRSRRCWASAPRRASPRAAGRAEARRSRLSRARRRRSSRDSWRWAARSAGRVRARAPRVGRAGGQRTELAVRPGVRRRRDAGVSPHARRPRAARRGGARRARRRHRDGLRGERRAGLPLRRARPVTIAALVHVVVSGLATGSIYALVVLSLVIVYNASPFPSFCGPRPIVLGPVRVAPVSLGIIGASLALMLGLWALFTRTRLGRAMRAVAQNQRAARLVGISVERVYAASWILASVVGAIAGILIAPVVFLSSQMGLIAINGFIAAVLGGFGSMPGAVVGGMLLGVIENLAPLYLPSSIKHSVPFLVLIAILLIRPGGMLGRVVRRKV